MSIRTSLTLAALAAIASPLAAQGRGNDGDRVPRGHLPPPGECRIWIDGVPPGRQPEPTDCATARRHVPRNGRVIYGERTTATRDDDRWIDRVRRDRDGRYDDRDDGRYDRDRKSADVGDRKYDDRDDRKYDDRDDGKYDDRNARKESDRRETGVRIFDNDDDDDRRVTDRKMSDRKETARKR